MSFKENTFSVIIPLYNKEDYIGPTLRSVLNQQFGGFEVIVIDDGSTDNSLEIVHTFTDPRIKVFSKENGGVSSARNLGIQKASFDYLAFLDADDLWEPTYLEEMTKLIARFPGCGLYASAYKVIEKKKIYNHCDHLPAGIINNYFKTELTKQITRLSATVSPTAIAKKVGGFPVGMVSGEDSFFCAKIAINYKMAITPKVLVSYNKASSGIALRHGKMDSCTESWFDLYEEGNFYKNEFIAEKAIKAGIRYALGYHKEKSKEIEKLTQYTKCSKRKWRYLFILNRAPKPGIKIYKKMKPLYKLMKTLL